MKNVVHAIIEKQNTVLLLKRGPTSPVHPNYWSLPGGTVDEGETFEKTVVREVKEETGLDVKPLEEFSIYYYPDNKKEVAEFAVHAFKTELLGGEVILSWEHTDFQWVSKDTWQVLHYTPAAKATLEKLFG